MHDHEDARLPRRDRLPRYLQVASVLRRRVEEGYWHVGDKIATLEALEQEFGVARVTVRQAVELLQNDGILKSFQGRGTFVTKAATPQRWLQLASDWESLVAPIRDNVLELLPSEPAPPPPIGPDDGLAAPAYTYIRSLQKRGSEPYAIARVHLAADLHALAPQQFATRPALAVLAELVGVEIAQAHQTLSISAADVETARLLDVAMNAPTAEARCLATDRHGTVLYLGLITYRGDVVRLKIDLLERRG
jgi:GntR family transcriptional regulator